MNNETSPVHASPVSQPDVPHLSAPPLDISHHGSEGSLSLIFIRFLDSIANGALITIANGALVIARLQLVSASGRRAGRPITVIPLKGSYTSA